MNLAYCYVDVKLADTWLNFVKSTMGTKDPYFTDIYEEGDVFDLGGIEVILFMLPITPCDITRC